MGLRAGLRSCRKSSPHRDLISGPTSLQQVTILTEIFWPTAGSVFTKWQFFVTDLDSCTSRQVTNTFRQNVSTKNCLSLYFCTNITHLSVHLLSIDQVFSAPCKTVYLWVTTNCCFYERYAITLAQYMTGDVTTDGRVLHLNMN